MRAEGFIPTGWTWVALAVSAGRRALIPPRVPVGWGARCTCRGHRSGLGCVSDQGAREPLWAEVLLPGAGPWLNWPLAICVVRVDSHQLRLR